MNRRLWFASRLVGVLFACALFAAPGVFAQSAAEHSVALQPNTTSWLPVASDGQNLWIISDQLTPKGTVEHWILHHAVGMKGAYARKVLSIDTSPLALSAADGQLWMILPASDALRQRREIYSLATTLHDLTGVYSYEPIGRLRLLGSMAEDGAFAGAANDAGVLMALRTPGAPERLSGIGWQPAPGAPQGEALMQWGRRPAVVTKREPLELAIATEKGTWEPQPLTLPAGATVRAITGSTRPAVVVTLADGTAVLAYVNGSSTAPITTLPRVAGPWAVAGLGDSFVLLEAASDGSVAMRKIHGVDGKASEPLILTMPPSPAGEWIHFPLLGMLAVALLLAIFLIRHVGPQARMESPYGFQALSAKRRILALLIDLVPGVAVVLVLGYEPRSLLQLPMLSPSAAAAVPGTIWVLVTLGMCTLLELTTGASLGKWIVGGRVARMDPPGARPAVWQVLARNVFKGMVLLVPVVGILVLYAPGGRGVGEILSATAIIERRPRAMPLKPDSADRR